MDKETQTMMIGSRIWTIAELDMLENVARLSTGRFDARAQAYPEMYRPGALFKKAAKKLGWSDETIERLRNYQFTQEEIEALTVWAHHKNLGRTVKENSVDE